jgi:hypothetical protein
MIANILALLAVIAVALADTPALPAQPTQYMVDDISLDMKTNAGYPPHYTQTTSAEYYDFEKQMTRSDVKETSYGEQGPYVLVNNYNEQFSTNCGKEYPDVQAPRGYMVKGNTCCYVALTDGCPYDRSTGEIPTGRTMYPPTLPTKIVYGGVSDGEGIIPAGDKADLWINDIFLKQEVPVIHNEFYFDVNDHTTQLGNFMNINAGPQFINATTTYNGEWTLGAQEAELFDVSAYDCSHECKSSVSDTVRLAGKKH